MWLGKKANKTDTLFGVQWPQRPFSALGMSFAYNLKLCKQENSLQKVSKIQKLFKIWSERDLSLYVTIAKTLGLSKLIFVSACIHTSPHYIDIINRLTTNFVWNNKNPKINRVRLLVQKTEEGWIHQSSLLNCACMQHACFMHAACMKMFLHACKHACTLNCMHTDTYCMHTDTYCMHAEAYCMYADTHCLHTEIN